MRMGAWRAKPVTRSRSRRAEVRSTGGYWKGGSRQAKDSDGSQRGSTEGRAVARMRRCLILRQGASPETLPLSLENTKLGRGKGGLWSGGIGSGDGLNSRIGRSVC